ncbi:MAG: SDR family NAD(P)-dependent oxidoreductase [Rhodospirillales bacterium]
MTESANQNESQTAPLAVITGASRGIGEATARYFLEQGWHVITCSRGPLTSEGGRPTGWEAHFEVDLADPEAPKAFVDRVLNVLAGRPLRALVNNAGMSPKAPFKERLGCLNGDLSAWRQVFELNVFAALKLSRGLGAALHKGRGSIVNVTSIAGHRIHPFAGSAYSISKAALTALTREMAGEFAALDVRVNAVCPGEIETSMIQPEYDMLIPRIPLERMGSPRDVAGTIHYLCSDAAQYVTGTEIWVTGGQHMV